MDKGGCMCLYLFIIVFAFDRCTHYNAERNLSTYYPGLSIVSLSKEICSNSLRGACCRLIVQVCLYLLCKWMSPKLSDLCFVTVLLNLWIAKDIAYLNMCELWTIHVCWWYDIVLYCSWKFVCDCAQSFPPSWPKEKKFSSGLTDTDHAYICTGFLWTEN